MKLQMLKSIRFKPLAAATAAILLAAAAVHAEGEPGKLTLSGFTDAAAGEQLAVGDYAAVIERLAPHTGSFDVDKTAASTNLCVAYVATGQLDEAHDACDDAITMARLDYAGGTLEERLGHREAVAIAYANRAVLGKLSGE